MDKASMLYNRFKNTFLVGDGEEVVSAAFLRSLLDEKEREEAERVELCRERLKLEEGKERRTDGGGQEDGRGEEKNEGMILINHVVNKQNKQIIINT